MANVRVTAGLNELLSLVTFFAAAKKVTPAPGRGSANKPTRTRDPAKTPLKPYAKTLFLINRRQHTLRISQCIVELHETRMPRPERITIRDRGENRLVPRQ